MGLRFAGRCAWLRSVNWSRLALGLALLAGMVTAYAEFDAAKLQEVLVWVQSHKLKGGALFVVGYTLGVVLMLPAMVMGMAAGAVFGLIPGSVLAWLGCSLGQVLAFVIGRYLLREPVKAYLTQQFPQWTAIDRALEAEAWKLVTLLRLSPLAPWNVLNYALAVTSVPLGAYAAASTAAILPFTILFAYGGSLARSLADIFAGDTGLDAPATLALAAVSGVLMVGGVWYTTHVSRRAIGAALLTHADSLPPELTTDADVVALLRVADFDLGVPAEEGAAEGEGGSAQQQQQQQLLEPEQQHWPGRKSVPLSALAVGDVEMGSLLPEGRAIAEANHPGSPLRSPGPRGSGAVTPVFGTRHGGGATRLRAASDVLAAG